MNLPERPIAVFSLDRRIEPDGSLCLIPLGELDIASSVPLGKALGEHSGSRLVLDLSGVSFLDSAGLRLLLQTSRRACSEGWDFLVRPGPPAVQRVFELTETLTELTFSD